jgi:hypothetical protein
MIYKLTKQEAFDKVVKHLVKQGMPAIDNMQCQYQTTGGLKCAAGCLIERKSVRDQLEGNWSEVLEAKPYLRNLVDPELVSSLQKSHDRCTNLSLYRWKEEWIGSMQNIAKDFKLNTNLLKKLATQEWVDKPTD